MKKFTSILFALCVTLGAIAMPQDKALRSAMFDRRHPVGLVKMDDSSSKKEGMRRIAAAKKEDLTINFETAMSCSYSTSYSQWHIQASNTEYAFNSWINGEAASIAGSYETADFDLPSYCYLMDVVNEKRIVPQEIAAEISEAEGRIDVEIAMIDSLGNNYIITMFYEDPVADSQVEFTATNLEIGEESYWGMFTYTYLIAGDESLGIELTYWGEDAFVGTQEIDGDDLSGYMIVDGEEVNIFSGSIEIEATDDGYHVTGTVLAYNNVEYILDLTYVLPDATRTASISAAVGFYNAMDDYGLYQLYGYTADQSKYISLAIYADQVAGQYTKSDLYLDYSYLVEFVGGDTLFLDILTADLTVTMDAAGAIACTGTLRVQNYDDPSDVVDYTINLTSTYADAEVQGLDYDEQDADFSANFATYTVVDEYLDEYGDLLIDAQNAEGAIMYLDLYIPAGTSELAAGTYNVANSEQPMTAYPGQPYNGSVYPSLAGYVNAQGYLTNVWFMVSGTVVVNADGSIVVNGQNSYGKSINATLAAPTAVEQVNADAVAGKRIVNGMLLIERNGEIYNAQGIRQ